MTNFEWIREKLLKDEITIKDLYCNTKINYQNACKEQSSKCNIFSKCVDCLEDWLNREIEVQIECCPFCGNDVVRISRNPFAQKFYIQCMGCDARSSLCETEESAIELWNSIRKEKENDKF